MQTVVYLSGSSVLTAVGSGGARDLRVRALYADTLPEGCLINGIVTDEAAFRASLEEIFERRGLPRRNVTLSVNSTELVTRLLTLPRVSARQTGELVEREFAQTERVTDPVFGWRVFSRGEKGADVFCAMADRAFLEKTCGIFAAAGIRVSAVAPALWEAVRFLDRMEELRGRTCAVQLLDGNMLTCILRVEGRYAYSQRTRLSGEEGSEGLADEIAGTFSSVRQFYAALHRDAPLKTVYLGGMGEDLLAECAGALARQELEGEPLPDEPRLTCPEGHLRDALYAAGGCLPPAQELNLLSGIRRGGERRKKRRKLLLRLLPVGAAVLVCALWGGAVLARNASLKKQSEALETKIQSEEVQTQLQTAEDCAGRVESLAAELDGLNAARSAIDSYPRMNTDVLAAVQACRSGSVTIEVEEYSAEEGLLLLNAYASNADESNPLIAKLKKTGCFADVQYVGYHYDESSLLYEISIACYLNAAAGKGAAG